MTAKLLIFVAFVLTAVFATRLFTAIYVEQTLPIRLFWLPWAAIALGAVATTLLVQLAR